MTAYVPLTEGDLHDPRYQDRTFFTGDGWHMRLSPDGAVWDGAGGSPIEKWDNLAYSRQWLRERNLLRETEVRG